MEQKLDCEIVRDLLPSYVDGLTGAATNAAIDAHLETCGDCAAALRHMKGAEEPQQPPAAEVDYLRKVRRHTARTGMVCGIVMMLVGMSLLLFRIFYVGGRAEAEDVHFNVSVDGNTVSVGGTLASSTTGVARVEFEQSAGIVNIVLHTAPKAFFNSGSLDETFTAEGPVGMVRCGGLILWENGVEIGRMAAQLYEASNPFVGDMPANGRIASILGVFDQFGPYSSELHTSQEPYGWGLILEQLIPAGEDAAAREVMAADAYAMLAAVENLSYVTWDYETEAGRQSYTVTAADASAFAGLDIKQCAASAPALQALLDRLSLKWSAVRELPQERGTFYLTLRLETEEALSGLALRYYLDDALIGSRAAENADGSPLTAGSEFSFDFTLADFPAGTTAEELVGVRFDLAVTGTDGRTGAVCEGVRVLAKYGWSYFYTLTGDFDGGFTLSDG